MNEKPEGCRGCPLYESGRGFVPDSRPLANDVSLVIIGEAPGKTEIAKGEPFVGPAGFILKEWGFKSLPDLQFAYQAGQVHLGNTLRCLPPNQRGRNYPIGQERLLAEQQCRQYDSFPISAVVLLLGEAPQRAFFRDELNEEDQKDNKAGRGRKGVLGRVGRAYEKDGRKWVFGVHPAALLREPRLAEHLEIGLRIALAETKGSVPSARISTRVSRQPILPDSHYVGLDLEWNKKGEIKIYGLAWGGGKQAAGFSQDEEADNVIRQLLERCAKPNGPTLVGHNIIAADLPRMRQASFDVDALLRSGDRFFDTLLGLHATHAHLAGTGSYDVRSLALLIGQQGTEPFPLDWKRYDEDIWETCALDAAAALYCGRNLLERVRALGLESTTRVSHAVAPIFEQMGRAGVKVDVEVLKRIDAQRNERKNEILDSLPKVVRSTTYKRKENQTWEEPINYRSPEILRYFAKEFRIKLPNRDRSTFARLASGSLRGSVGSSQELARRLGRAIVELSELGSDAAWIGKKQDEGGFSKVSKDGFIFPQYNVVGTPDRPSASNPNIQNFPRVADDRRPIALRQAIVPPNVQMALVSADFSHIESYTTAIEAGDSEMVSAIQSGALSHEATANYINHEFGLALTRQQGKTCNHARDKGEGAGNLSLRLFGNRSRANIGRAQQILDALLAPYPRTRQFRDELWKECERNNPYEARNRFGRRLLCFGRDKQKSGEEEASWMTADKRRENQVRARWKEALAFLGRGSAVDVLLRVMAKIYLESRLDSFSLPYIEIHDELVYAIPKESVHRYSQIIHDSFSEPVGELDSISLPCEVHTGANWAECK